MIRSAIALGSNQGDSLQIVQQTLRELTRIPGIKIDAVSSWYQTKPVGIQEPQPDYLNGCAVLSVAQTPEELLTLLQAIEIQFGRDSNTKGQLQPRTLDLDLLLYGDLVLDTANLTIPHPRMTERAFVLVPLAEIAPHWIEPKSQQSIAQLLARVDTSGVVPYVVT